jgi:hypothetical protein
LDDEIRLRLLHELAHRVLGSTGAVQGGGDLMSEIDPLFKMLIERTRTLVTVTDNAAAVLSEEFESMVTGPLVAVKDVLAMCPDVAAWDGSFQEEDIIIEGFRHDSQPPGPDVGVRIRHVPTDLSVESYSKRTQVDNELVARRALADLVQNRWEALQEGQGDATARARRGRRTRLG